MKNIISLIKYEIKIELRQKHALSSVFLFAAAAIFICYLALQTISSPMVWMAFYWLIILFASINMAHQSFIKQAERRFLYYYSILAPGQLIITKILLNGFFVMLIALISLLCFSLFFGLPVYHIAAFFFTVIAGSFAISSIITLMSAISAKAKGNAALVSILSFPILIPSIITILKLSNLASLNRIVDFSTNFSVLIALIVIVFMLAYLLFAYLWRD